MSHRIQISHDRRHRPLLAVAIFALTLIGTAQGQTTQFTYQGKLNDNGNPASGQYDFQFKLFDTATVGTGTQQGSTVDVPNVPVTAGIFTVQLDFGAAAFPGAQRFLDISVRPAGGGVFTMLAPRQAVTSIPYALRSVSAGAADTAMNATQLGGLTAGGFVQNRTSQQAATNFNISGNGTIGGNLTASNIGIGTPNPQRPLQIGPDLDPGFTFAPADVTPNAGYIRFGDSTGWKLHIGRNRESSGGPLNNGTTGVLMTIQDDGNVGVGTVSPDTKLDIHGSVASDNGVALKLFNSNASNFNRWYLGTGGAVVAADAFSIGDTNNYKMTLLGNGNVGIGTVNPTQGKLHVEGGTGIGVYGKSDGVTGYGVYGTSNNYLGVFGTSNSGTGVAGYSISGIGVRGHSNSGDHIVAHTVNDFVFRVANDGTVHAPNYQGLPDFAEAILPHPAEKSRLEPGDVLVAGPDTDRTVTRSRKPYSTSVLGVYSTAPGFIGTENPIVGPSSKMIPMAVIGIVPCKVSAENGPIRRGDLLTTSRTPGHAMRCRDRRRCSGAIVGKALATLDRGTGVIKVLVTLQ